MGFSFVFVQFVFALMFQCVPFEVYDTDNPLREI